MGAPVNVSLTSVLRPEITSSCNIMFVDIVAIKETIQVEVDNDKVIYIYI